MQPAPGASSCKEHRGPLRCLPLVFRAAEYAQTRPARTHTGQPKGGALGEGLGTLAEEYAGLLRRNLQRENGSSARACLGSCSWFCSKTQLTLKVTQGGRRSGTTPATQLSPELPLAQLSNRVPSSSQSILRPHQPFPPFFYISSVVVITLTCE